MNRLSAAAVLLLAFTVLSAAGSLKPEPVTRIQALTLEGLEHAYNFDFASANRLFDEAIAAEPAHPRPLVSKSFIALWQYLLSKNDADYRGFLSQADRCIEAGDQYIDKYGENAEALTCLGLAYGYRAFAYARAKSYLKAAWDGKKSFDYFSDALKRDSLEYDAYLGIGVFHYFTAHIPKPLRWIVSILGIDGDSDLGMKEIRLAAERGTFSRIEAQYYLAQFLPWQEADFSAGERILTELNKNYPDNLLFRFTLAVWELERNDVASAKDHLASIVRQQKTDIDGIRPFALYKLADCYFRLSQYDVARTYYQEFLKGYTEDIYRAASNCRIGICDERTGQRLDAIPFYRKAAAAERNFGDDAYAARRAERFLNHPMSASDTLLLEAQNALGSGAFDRARTLFLKLQSSTDSATDVVEESYYGMGDALFRQKLYREALDQYRHVLSASPKDEVWLLPWAHYQSGLCLLRLGENERARREFQGVLDYDNYDFRDWLHFRSERELSKFPQE